jgi:transcriptional regulator with XRE-family HTH domain
MQKGRRPKKRTEGTSSPLPQTRLQQWLDDRQLTSAQLETKSGISRQTMTKIRAGSDLRKKTMIRIARAASVLAATPVLMDELFDLDPFSSENVRLVPI